MEIKVIESAVRDGAYDMRYVEAIIQHPKHRRLYLCEGWGGGNLKGEAYRWKHGVVAKLEGGDTLESLGEPVNDAFYTLREDITTFGNMRQVFTWSGNAVEALADACGL